jgi:transcriptional regulator with XRE-family HTH domain
MRNFNLESAIIAAKFQYRRDFARAAGDDPATVSRIINGMNTSQERKKRYARILGRSVEELFPTSEQQRHRLETSNR